MISNGGGSSMDKILSESEKLVMPYRYHTDERHPYDSHGQIDTQMTFRMELALFGTLTGVRAVSLA